MTHRECLHLARWVDAERPSRSLSYSVIRDVERRKLHNHAATVARDVTPHRSRVAAWLRNSVKVGIQRELDDLRAVPGLRGGLGTGFPLRMATQEQRGAA